MVFANMDELLIVSGMILAVSRLMDSKLGDSKAEMSNFHQFGNHTSVSLQSEGGSKQSIQGPFGAKFSAN